MEDELKYKDKDLANRQLLEIMGLIYGIYENGGILFSNYSLDLCRAIIKKRELEK